MSGNSMKLECKKVKDAQRADDYTKTFAPLEYGQQGSSLLNTLSCRGSFWQGIVGSGHKH